MAKLLLFDIDGTLIDSAGSGRRSLKSSINAVTGLNCDQAIDFSFMGKTDMFIIKTILTKMSIEVTETILSDIKNLYIKDLETNITQNNNKKVIEGVHNFLTDALSHDDVILSLQTGNIMKGAFIKLRSLGLDKYFNTGGFGDFHENRTEIIKQAVESIWSYGNKVFSSNDVVVIGDTPADIYAGKAFKYKTVGVCSKHKENPGMMDKLKMTGPDLIINNYNRDSGIYEFILGDKS